MPNQDPTQNQNNQNPANQSGAAPVQEPPVVPPVISPQADLPPLPPDFQNIPEESGAAPSVPPTESERSAAPSPVDISSVIPTPKKKFGGGKIIATILGLFVLIGGVGAGIVLTQQQQLFQQKAASTCSGTCSGGVAIGGTACYSGTQVATCECSGSLSYPTFTISTCSTGACSGGSCVSSGNGTGGGGNSGNGTGGGVGSGGGGGLPNCGTNLYCQEGSLTGGTKCNSNGQTLYCCGTGHIISSGNCVAMANCGIGLSCGYSQISGSSVCASAGNTVYCCPSGQVYSEFGSCSNPSGGSGQSGSLAGSGASCANGEVCDKGLTCSPDFKVCVTADPGTCTATSCTAVTGCVVNHYHCDDIKASGVACNDNETTSSSASFSYSCGTEQIDITCGSVKTPAKFISKRYATACNSGGGSPTPKPTAPYCVAVKAYDSSWAELSSTQLSALTAGATVNFCVSGSAPSGTFDMAQFTINGTQLGTTTTQRPSSTDFCQSYTILSTDTTVTVSAKIHHSTLGWF